ncbi:hypothetical protein [Haloplanus pelagicus]|uniref:hypothetical protein n=1 Tax=Haloplanus pelagicus TaxID=2949995 RepID=UPI0020425401|nr:hypothetical protein [Haloplanus sp. HW8-1]
MTRKTRREIEETLEELEEELDSDEEFEAIALTPEEKEWLAEEFDVDPWEEGKEMGLTDLLLDDNTEDA